MIYDTWRKYIEYLDDPSIEIGIAVEGTNLTVMIHTYICGDWESHYLGEHLAKWCCLELNDEGNTDTTIPRGWIHDIFELKITQMRLKREKLQQQWDGLVKGNHDPCPSTSRIEY